MTKRICALIVILALIYMPVFADSQMIINGDFEDGTIAFLGATASYDEPYAGQVCAFLNSPLQYSDDDGVYRESAYLYSVPLEEGFLYEFKMAVKSSVPSLSEPFLRADYNYTYNRITVDVLNIASQWNEVSMTFVSGSSGNFELCLNVYDSEYSEGVYIDNVSIIQKKANPVSMRIEGTKNVLVPEIGEISYKYRAVATDSYGNSIPIITGKINTSALPQGMYFSTVSNTLTVTSDAVVGESFTMYAAPPYGLNFLPNLTMTVTAGDNYIENGDFSDYPYLNGYEADLGTLSYEENDAGGICARLVPSEQDEGTFISTLSIDKTFLLIPDKLYVLHAVVFSDEGFSSRYTQSSNAFTAPDGIIYFNISNVCSQRREVFSVIEISASGVYQIKINFINPDDRPVYIASLGLYVEDLAPSQILFNTPAHICIPESGELTVPVDFAVCDQAGSILSGYNLSLYISPQNAGVSINGKTLSVLPSAQPDEYKICASVDGYGIYGECSIDVSDISIGDGSFESQPSGQWFQTAQPSSLSISSDYESNYPADGDKIAVIKFNGCVSAVLSDSIYKFEAGKAYVFNGYLKKTVPDIDTVVTLIIYNADTSSFDESLAVSQFTLSDSGKVNKVFIPSEDITGRIMIGFNTPSQHSTQVVLMDELSITQAKVTASGASISGYPCPGKILTGKHKFAANFETAELSTFCWLSSPSKDGVYMPIEGENSQVLSVTDDMVGKYVKYEVTPASLNGPVYGESITSSAVYITSASQSQSQINTASSEAEQSLPQESDASLYPSEQIIKKQDGQLSVINIYSPTFKNTYDFYDTKGHWAYDDIKIMSAAEIVNGRGNMLFEPDALITRAEFSAILIRSFSLAPLYYTDCFADVKSWNWYSGVVETVTKYNISSGTGDSMFSPDAPLTREQMAVMIVRALKLTGAEIKSDLQIDFTDKAEISDWAYDNLMKAVSCGLVLGFPDNSFAPQKNCTRAEATALIKRMIEYVLLI